MARFTKQTELGMRWLTCGWRLFTRNPWLLAGMGFCSALLVAVVALIPFLGSLIVALIAPMLLASAYLAVDRVSQLKSPLPASLRRAAIRQSPLELVGVFRDERHVMPVAVAALYSIAVAVLVNILARLVAGSAWESHWAGLDILSLLRVCGAALLALLIYGLLALSLVYALPLAFLRDEPLIPSILRSVRTSVRHAAALVVILPLLLVPLLLGGIVARFSVWAAYPAGIALGAIVLPVVVTSLYCSYRTVFPTR